MAMKKSKVVFDFGDFSITVREIIGSISIIAILLLFGVLISSSISESYIDKNEVYNKALKIDNNSLFEYGMRTNVGNAFVYGDLEAIDTVTYPEIGGEYMHVEKVKERYTQHTRVVTKTRTVNGKSQTYTETQVYWTWDRVGHEELTCKEISFLGVTFNSDKIDLPGTSYIDTINESSHVRYKYYGTDTKYTGTIFTDLRDGTISDGTHFYDQKDINQTVEYLEKSGTAWVIAFWVIWIILTALCVYGFFYIDNKWLE